MSKKRRDDEITQQIRVGRDALDEAVRANVEATKRVQSTIPPESSDPESAESPERESDDEEGERPQATDKEE